MAQPNSRNPRMADKAPPKAAVRAQLARILVSAPFRGSTRKAKFLTYVIEQALNGHTDRLTAYDIAVNAFDQDERFDPQTNPLIRIAARRVREALDRYYLTSGGDDPLRITIPVGHYVPAFEPMPGPGTTSEAATGPSPPPSAEGEAEPTPIAFNRRAMQWRYAGFGLAVAVTAFVAFEAASWAPREAGPAISRSAQRVTVEPLENATGDPEFDRLALSLNEQIQAQLSSGAQVKFAAATGDADLVLKGTLERFNNGVRAQSLLISARSGKVLWAHAYPLIEPGGPAPSESTVAGDIAQQIGRIAERR